MSNRLLKEYKELQKNKDSDLVLRPNDNTLYQWRAELRGPPDTPYEGSIFEVELRIPNEYPIHPPTAYFITKIFHPNVHFKVLLVVFDEIGTFSTNRDPHPHDQTGEICLDILKSTWSPAWTLQSVCRAIITLLSHPEPDSPLNCDAGNLLRHGDHRGFRSLARMYAKLCATPVSKQVPQEQQQ
eukprot:GEZU01017418.1.p1 GENE.GEZU01017418.1~~GEZU01017418.1.p1  ORF type:complete len:184 (-),score=11.71 GEZU01017418.1:62-613(-)